MLWCLSVFSIKKNLQMYVYHSFLKLPQFYHVWDHTNSKGITIYYFRNVCLQNILQATVIRNQSNKSMI